MIAWFEKNKTHVHNIHASSRLGIRLVYYCYTIVQLHIGTTYFNEHKIALGKINDQ